MSTLVVIVNYCTPQLTIDCLASLAADKSLPADTRVTVVDNASPDGSAVRIQSEIASRGWATWASLIAHDHNGGFSAGNNVAIRAALRAEPAPDYVWLLNSDTRVHPGAHAALVRFLENEPAAGIVGSRLEDPDGTWQCSAFRFPSLASEVNEALQFGLVQRWLANRAVVAPVGATACQVGWVAGASLLVRREVFDTIGLLDEKYFLYYEEVDFCRRAAEAGWSCWYEPASRVIHLVGQSTGVSVRTRPGRRPRYWFDSRRRYFTQHHGSRRAAMIDACWSLAYPWGHLYRRLRRRVNADPPWLWFDLLRYRFFSGSRAYE